VTRRAAEAVACANIALAKYWGKADERENLPAVPSLSLTLDGLSTRTRVELDPALEADAVVLDAAPAAGRARERVVGVLDELRRLRGERSFARVTS
jgi:diphosphomevalonate decarboxylase